METTRYLIAQHALAAGLLELKRHDYQRAHRASVVLYVMIGFLRERGELGDADIRELHAALDGGTK